jgi:hypothetical protein
VSEKPHKRLLDCGGKVYSSFAWALHPSSGAPWRTGRHAAFETRSSLVVRPYRAFCFSGLCYPGLRSTRSSPGCYRSGLWPFRANVLREPGIVYVAPTELCWSSWRHYYPARRDGAPNGAARSVTADPFRVRWEWFGGAGVCRGSVSFEHAATSSSEEHSRGPGGPRPYVGGYGFGRSAAMALGGPSRSTGERVGYVKVCVGSVSCECAATGSSEEHSRGPGGGR